MGTASVHKSWRKACGAIKDSATVGLAKVNGGGRERKDLDVAVVKATAHVERPPKERHFAGEIKDSLSISLGCHPSRPSISIVPTNLLVVPAAIFASTSTSRPLADVSYCVHTLAD